LAKSRESVEQQLIAKIGEFGLKLPLPARQTSGFDDEALRLQVGQGKVQTD
jgi:hypothetical protein